MSFTGPDSTRSSGNEIILSNDPKGVFLGVHLDPDAVDVIYGTVIQLKAGATPIGGRNVYQKYNKSASGVRALIAVLIPRYKQGDALEEYGETPVEADAGTYHEAYVPQAGEELMMRVAATGTGTGDAIAVGDTFMIEDGTGLLVATSGSEQSAPFQCTKAVDDVESTGTLVQVIYTGY